MTAPEPDTTYARRLLATLRRRAPALAVFVVLLGLFDATRAWTNQETAGGFAIGMVTAMRVNWILLIPAALAPLLVETTRLRPLLRAALTVSVTFLLVGLPTVALALLYEGPITEAVRKGLVLSNEAFLIRSWWFYSAAGLLFAAYCQSRDREVATIRAARAAELERADAQRDIMASRLQVLQARVEPELLFGALGDVRGAYLRDPEAAGALLDDLIAYLRAALPQMRGGTSTLQREATLAEAYLKVVPAGRSGALAVDVRVAEDLGATPFPPMVLLPLAHAASEATPATIRIAAPVPDLAVAAGTNSVEISMDTASVPVGWQDPQLLPIRGALQNHFGAEAALRIAATGDRVSAFVTWPLADAPRQPAAPTTLAAA